MDENKIKIKLRTIDNLIRKAFDERDLNYLERARRLTKEILEEMHTGRIRKGSKFEGVQTVLGRVMVKIKGIDKTGAAFREWKGAKKNNADTERHEGEDVQTIRSGRSCESEDHQ